MEELINDWDLVDIKSIRGIFTWTNKIIRKGHIAARLDHTS
jgi:hypothetical protein